MSTLSTHVLDTMLGRPAAGVAVTLSGGGTILATAATDADGRCRAFPELSRGVYRLVFAAGAYLRGLGIDLADPPFLDEVPIDFGIGAVDLHYHVPLLLSPYGYATYRGS